MPCLVAASLNIAAASYTWGCISDFSFCGEPQGSLGAIEDQQLLLDEHGLSDHGTHAARTSQAGDRPTDGGNRTARSRTTQS
jgi:hypothetical protein